MSILICKSNYALTFYACLVCTYCNSAPESVVQYEELSLLEFLLVSSWKMSARRDCNTLRMGLVIN